MTVIELIAKLKDLPGDTEITHPVYDRHLGFTRTHNFSHIHTCPSGELFLCTEELSRESLADLAAA